ncbi:hypothetical protein SUGI_0073410 [Cryptomeria japonica]|nr:hypothetical protein SUGI_0073410 [Cryptomeria japonica]
MQGGFYDVSAMTCSSHSSNGLESLSEERNSNSPSMKERVSVLLQVGGRPWMGGRERGMKIIDDSITCDCNLELLVVVVRKLVVRPRETRTLANLRNGIKWP